VSWKYFSKTSDAINELKEKGYKIIAVEQAEGSIALQDLHVENGRKYAFVFGHEVNGVDQEIVNSCDLCVEIPQFGTKHSFNIAISAGIVLWEVNKPHPNPSPKGERLIT
jgi:tRNA G18 (ribose-2'-O)-methylase SpoU